ncbi:cation transporter, partial [Algiphilus sp.]
MDWTGFDAPALRDAASRDLGDGRREALLRVDGMHCSACARRIERALAPLARDVRVHLGTGTVEVDWDARRHPFSAVLGALDAAGFTPAITGAPASSARAERRTALKRIGVALIFGMQVMMLASGHYFGAIDAAYAGLMR